MPHHAKPKIAKCFRCKEWFLIKFVPFYRRFSLKNDWGYWTQKDDKKKDDKKICDACLKKYREEIKKIITIPRIRATLDRYISRMPQQKFI